jgi:hypothetical protein
MVVADRVPAFKVRGKIKIGPKIDFFSSRGHHTGTCETRKMKNPEKSSKRTPVTEVRKGGSSPVGYRLLKYARGNKNRSENRFF